LNARRLELSDRLLGSHRFSAYDLRPAMMRRAAEELLRFRPAYVLGYSVALDLFAEANRDRREQLRASGVRLVLGTAEAFPTPESADRLRDLFDCDVAMEYGAVETGLMAHTHPEGGYRAFWRSYLLEVAGGEHSGRLLVTSLYPRCLPLVRYEIGDEIELGEAPQDSRSGIGAFERVIGRCNDYVLLADGTTVHSEVFSHVVRPCTSIRGFQIIQSSEQLRLRFTSAEELPEAEKLALLERLEKVHPDLQRLAFERVDHLEQTVAGKTRMVIREP
jgi:phenylacetate-CoA ligase